MIGTIIGEYRVESRLGAGGMGEVWLATDMRLGRKVALKLLPLQLTKDPALASRLEREARAASVLNHPNVCTILGLGVHSDGQRYIAMEHVDGSTLRDRMLAGPLGIADALDVAIQVASALSAAHAAGIVHRDVKPENVMIRPDGLVKVLDFGLAKLVTPVDESRPPATTTLLSTVGTVVGTAGYMSPEQAEGTAVDHRSDVFAFCSMLYELLAGTPAFRRESTLATLAAVLEKEPAPLPVSLPPDLKTLVMRCLRKRPDERHNDMRDVRIALEDIRDGVVGHHGGVQKGRRSPRVSVPAAAAWGLLAVGVAAAMWVYQATRDTKHLPLEAVPLTSDAGFEEAPSFSPDGNQVAYSWDGPNRNNIDIYIKLIGAPRPLRLTTDPADDLYPAFSPDGRSVGFVRVSGTNATYVVTPAVGGSERTVAAIPATSADPITPAGASWSSAWLPGGRGIVLDGLRVLSLDTGELRPVRDGSGTAVTGWFPAVAPDGHSLAFCRPASVAAFSLYALDLAGNGEPRGSPRKLADVDGDVFGLTWTSDSRQIVFAGGELSGTSGLSKVLWKVAALEGARPERLPFGVDLTLPAISRYGARLAFVRNSLAPDIYRARIMPPDAASAPVERFVSSTRSDWNPQYSPDGRRLAFESTRTGQSAIWMSDAEGSNLVEVFSKTGKHSGTPRWSPDSQWLAFDSSAEGNFDIYVIRPGSRQPRRLTTDPSDDAIPSWSPDGRGIYFASNRSGRREVWKVPAAGGSAVQITRSGGLCVHASTDGTRIYYTKNDGDSALWTMPVAGGPEREVLPSVMNRNFVVFGGGLYFIPRADPQGRYSIQYLDFATAAVTVVVPMAGVVNLGLSVSPDGRYATYAQAETGDSDLMLVEGFR